MTIGDQPAFPDAKSFNNPTPGMTYRMWLVGMIAGHVMTQDVEESWDVEERATACIECADAIIKRMEGEK